MYTSADTATNPAPCLIVGKDGAASGLTFGCYAGLESYLCDQQGVMSTELAIYALDKHGPDFSTHGDSGALIWDGLGRMVGQLHSGQFKGPQDTPPHVTYATPGWWLQERIQKIFPDAVFFKNTW
jgi:hypothetical protein